MNRVRCCSPSFRGSTRMSPRQSSQPRTQTAAGSLLPHARSVLRTGKEERWPGRRQPRASSDCRACRSWGMRTARSDSPGPIRDSWYEDPRSYFGLFSFSEVPFDARKLFVVGPAVVDLLLCHSEEHLRPVWIGALEHCEACFLVCEFLEGPVSYTHLRAHETVLDLVC